MYYSLFDAIINTAPREPTDGEPIWSNGDMILCRTEWIADEIAAAVENVGTAVGHYTLTHTGYYDPAEDERDKCVDKYTGWWYVELD